jgi:PKD repeat protein
VTITVTEVEAPTAVISTIPDPPTGIEPFTVIFDASQSSSSYSIVSYGWDFGDTGTGSGITTSHEYTTPGTYVVILTVTDSNSNVGYDSETITVYEAGVPSTITLQANPITVTAGGGTSLITATVKDAGGDPVTNGTVVTFHASTGDGDLSDTSVATSGGIAQTTLTLVNSGDETISSTVSAQSGSANDTVVVYCPPPPS